MFFFLSSPFQQVDLYIKNKQLINDNLKLQEKYDDLVETIHQTKNKEEKAANERMNGLERKVSNVCRLLLLDDRL